jgi:hypothetical protein
VETRPRLEDAVTDMQAADNALSYRLLVLFKVATGHLPQNDHELQAWLASPRGKAATRSRRRCSPTEATDDAHKPEPV